MPLRAHALAYVKFFLQVFPASDNETVVLLASPSCNMHSYEDPAEPWSGHARTPVVHLVSWQHEMFKLVSTRTATGGGQAKARRAEVYAGGEGL